MSVSAPCDSAIRVDIEDGIRVHRDGRHEHLLRVGRSGASHLVHSRRGLAGLDDVSRISIRCGPSSFSAPTLVVVGEHDFPDLHLAARYLADRLCESDYVTVPGTAHLPSLERPTDFDIVLKAFLAV